jgi:predicted PurR-regulated permease PerM
LDSAPSWVAPIIRQTIWRVIWIGLGTTIVVLSLLKARGLISTLVIAFFLSLAMDPAISALNAKRGWSRGRSAGFVLLVIAVGVVLLVTVLVPGLIQVTQTIAGRLPAWIASI